MRRTMIVLLGVMPGIAVAQSGLIEAAGDDPVTRVEAAIAQVARTSGRAVPVGGPPRSAGGRMAITTAVTRFADDPGQVHLFMATGPATGVCHETMPQAGLGRPVLERVMASCLNRFTARAREAKAAGGGQSAAGSATPAVAASAAAGQTLPPPRFAANWDRVSAVLFHLTYMTGVGGLPYPDYEPVILFKDGSYMEVQDAALEDMDLVANRAAKPKRWGRWAAVPGGYTLTGADGKPDTMKLQDGQLFKAFDAAGGGGTLARGYKRISGGGNSGLGGEMTIASSSEYGFAADGRFSRDGSFGAIGSGATSGVSMAANARNRRAAPGHYTLSRHTLTLRYADGRQARHFFAFGSHKSPAQVDTDMIFIDDSVYTHMADRSG